MEPEDDKPRTGVWRKVDPKIWAPGPPPSRLERLYERLFGWIKFSAFWIMVFAAPFFVLISFLIAYSIAGPILFGPVLLSLWSIMVIGFVIVMEKTGYARNFANSDFKLSIGRILSIPLVFIVLVSALYLMIFLFRKY